jgi:hypothetical protein
MLQRMGMLLLLLFSCVLLTACGSSEKPTVVQTKTVLVVPPMANLECPEPATVPQSLAPDQPLLQSQVGLYTLTTEFILSECKERMRRTREFVEEMKRRYPNAFVNEGGLEPEQVPGPSPPQEEDGPWWDIL